MCEIPAFHTWGTNRLWIHLVSAWERLTESHHEIGFIQKPQPCPRFEEIKDYND
jgi:hypothetical protein